jgi:hypothetical protein
MTAPLPGNDGDPVPAGVKIFRIGKNTDLNPAAIERRQALAIMFELSTADKAAAVPRLSVWVEALTVADQAWDFMGSNPARTVVACLSVDKVSAIHAQPGFAALRVEWEQAMIDDGNGNKTPNIRPGAEGHAGIAGLNQGGGKADSNKRKALRSALADIAGISDVPVPHQFEPEHLKVAAYYISRKPEQSTGTPDGDWIKAIRQLRRARANTDA